MIKEFNSISKESQSIYYKELDKIRNYEKNPVNIALSDYIYEKPFLDLSNASNDFNIDIKVINCVRNFYFKSKKNKSDTVILVIHGGGFVLPLSQNNIFGATLYSKYAGDADVLLPDYTVAGVGSHMKAVEDVYYSYLFLKEKYKNIFIAGQSAGSGLAISLVQYLSDLNVKMPSGIILASPWLDLKCEGKSYITNKLNDILFGSKFGNVIPNPYEGEYDDYMFPLNNSFNNFPPVMINVASTEMVLSDSYSLYEKLEEVNSRVELNIYSLMWHDFYTHNDDNKECKIAWKKISEFIKSIK